MDPPISILGIGHERLKSYLRKKVDEGFDVKPNADVMVNFILHFYSKGCATLNEFRQITKDELMPNLVQHMHEDTEEFVGEFIKFVETNQQPSVEVDIGTSTMNDVHAPAPPLSPVAQDEVKHDSAVNTDEITDRMQGVTVTDNQEAPTNNQTDAKELQEAKGEEEDANIIVIEEKEEGEMEEGEITETRRSPVRSRSRSRGRNSHYRRDDRSPRGREVIVVDSDDEEEPRSLDLRREQVRAKLKRQLATLARRQRRLASKQKELEEVSRVAREMLQKIDDGDDGYVFCLDQLETKEERRRRERCRHAPMPPRRESRVSSWRQRSMLRAKSMQEIVGKWSMKWDNGFTTTYTIYQDGTLTLPRNPPEDGDQRARIYGGTVHGWHGRARVRIENGKFYFSSNGYRPMSRTNGWNDRNSWEEATLDSNGTQHLGRSRLVSSLSQ
uniref:Uncharacterized protein n=1 Tax=Lotharella oceanica TaxID=641309 RepID=A0A7S2TET7_9EUKA